MENDDGDNVNADIGTIDENTATASALNSTILDYYKKFGRKRDLEQYFSLSTAQGDVKDPASLFWRRMKSQTDSDGEKNTESSTEICRISIKCSVPDSEPNSSQEEPSKRNSETESPPIITEPVDEAMSKHSDNESLKSEGNNSLKSLDATLDTSMNKPVSPASSITSQRKLEWDSLADVGYANETDRKNSKSSLSTLERLALRQQYSNNDSQNPIIGLPAAQSTPQEENENKSKGKRTSNTTKICSRDSDVVELNFPHSSDRNLCQPLNVNLTKHISFNVDKLAGVTVDNIQKEFFVIPEKVSVETEVTPDVSNKEIQTSLKKKKDKSSSSPDLPERAPWPNAIPVLINLNTTKRRTRKKKLRTARKHLKNRRLVNNKENLPVHEKSGEQVSEAESFEYMPGHIYNQNQMRNKDQSSNTAVGNKSSLESSGGLTTDSSKKSTPSLSKDLEKSINLLKIALQKRYNDSDLKQRLIKEIVQRLLKSNYKDDESTDFLSGISFSSKKLGLSGSNQTTTSNSDSAEKFKKYPRKSILRADKFDPQSIASTSQSAPNIPVITNSEIPVSSRNKIPLGSSATESDMSNKEKTFSDAAISKTSDEIYQKYIEALKTEKIYKKHLKDKEMFLKEKLVYSDTALRMPPNIDSKSKNRLTNMIKDLTRNNYDDGSGDASKLEGSHYNSSTDRHLTSNQRSHSVFTLSSNNNENRRPTRKPDDNSKPSHSRHNNHYCCCPYHLTKGVVDSSVQVCIQTQEGKTSPRSRSRNSPHVVSDNATGEIKYVCLGSKQIENLPGTSDDYLIYKCSRLNNKSVQSLEISPDNIQIQSTSAYAHGGKGNIQIGDVLNKSSQTNIPFMLQSNAGEKNVASHCVAYSNAEENANYVHEATRSIQTEICIDPRIAEPTLSDINIVADTECVVLIGENYRQVSKSTVTDEVADQQEQVITLVTPKDAPFSLPTPGGDNEQNNYSIPIKGTNMMLKVSLGPNKLAEQTVSSDKSQDKPKTDKKQSPRFNKDTSVLNTIFSQEGLFRSIYPEDLFLNTDKTLMPSTIHYNVPKESCHAQTDTDNIFLPELRPILRSNTDPRLLDNILPLQTAGFHSLPSRPQCLCSATACRNLCNEFAPCAQKNFRSANTGTYTSQFSPRQCVEVQVQTTKHDANTQSKKIECKVPDDVPPLRFLKSRSPIEDSDDPDTEGTNEIILPPQCVCGALADCKGNCPEGAPCMEPMQKLGSASKPSLGRNQSPKSCSPIKFIESESKSLDTAGCKSSRPSKCPCDALADCKGNCDEGAACMKRQEAILKRRASVKQIPDSNRASASCSPKILEESEFDYDTEPKCVCGPLADCKGSCSENAPCMKQQEPIRKLRSSAKPADSKSNSPKKIPKHAETQFDFKPALDCVAGDDDSNEAYWNEKLKTDSESKCSSTSKEAPKCKCVQPSKCKGLCGNTDCPKPGATIETQTSDSSVEAVLQKLHSNSKARRAELNKKSVPSIDDTSDSKDVVEIIQGITKRYSKKDLKSQKKKCFKEIMTLLNYLLDTEEPNSEQVKALMSFVTEESDSPECVVQKPTDKSSSSTQYNKTKTCDNKSSPRRTTCKVDIEQNVCCAKAEVPTLFAPKPSCECQNKTCVDKGIQICTNKSKNAGVWYTESSECPFSTDIPCTSSDSTMCKVLNKIKKECDKYHQKRCISHGKKRCECSSTTSVNCESCNRVHHCYCKAHKCRKHRGKATLEKIKKKCVAYNLIIQTSDSMISDENRRMPPPMCPPLKNIIVKVPPKRHCTNVPFKEMEKKIEGNITCNPRMATKYQRSRSLPHESGLSSADEAAERSQIYTVREYLERNRPDFVEECSKRQECLKILQNRRTSERSANRKLLSMQLQNEKFSTLNALSESDVRQLAKELGANLRQKKVQPKFISEKEMKKHSEKIYKSLPEVVQKKEDAKKERIKKTNLLMANIFKKNLQKKALQGAVNLSNYNSVVKII